MSNATTVTHTRCWNCGYECNRSTAIDNSSSPKDGDVSVCFDCGRIALFDSTNPDGVRKPSPSEVEELRGMDEVHQLLLSWYHYKQQEKKTGTKR